MSNLINNILKYTMKNNRVFITAFEKGGMIVMEFKNISAYPLNFNVEEITQRFVRGDESRTAEGNVVSALPLQRAIRRSAMALLRL